MDPTGPQHTNGFPDSHYLFGIILDANVDYADSHPPLS